MKQPNLEKWEDKEELKGLLFFALLVEELLFDHTVDTFKIPALNTNTLCDEAMLVIADIEQGVLKEGVVKPVLDELAYSIEKDPIIKEIMGSKLRHYCDSLKTGTLNDFKLRLIYLKHQLEGVYFQKCQQLLRIAVIDGKEKKLITQLSRIYLNELIYKGYSPSFIYWRSKWFFFEGKMPSKFSDPALIDEYFKCFDGSKLKWNVLFKVTREFRLMGRFIERFNGAVGNDPNALISIPRGDSAKKFLEIDSSHPMFVLIKDIEALDSHKAKHSAEANLGVIDSLVKYHIHQKKLAWLDKALVFDSTGRHTQIVSAPKASVLKRPDKPDDKLSGFADDTINSLMHVSEESRDRLIRALELHRTALQNPEEEKNQLLNFWAAIEILFPKSTNDSNRVEGIVEAMLPFLTKNYFAKLISYLFLGVQRCGGEEVFKIIDKVPLGNSSRYEKFMALLVIDDLKSIRTELYSFFSKNNPLIVNRICFIHERANSTMNILETLKTHGQRVSWHIRRIYRTRNLIIHSGQSLPYLGTLVENIHSYLDRILELIFSEFSKRPHFKSVDEITVHMELDYQQHHDSLGKGKTLCSVDNFKSFLFGEAL